MILKQIINKFKGDLKSECDYQETQHFKMSGNKISFNNLDNV